MRRRTTGLIGTGLAAVLVGVAALGSAGAHPPGEQPKRIWVGSGGLWTKGALGAYCWTRDGAGVCADRVYPDRVPGRLPVRPGGRVALIVPDHARGVSVSLTRVRSDKGRSIGWRTKAHRPTGNPHRWRLRLPARLRDADRIDVFARYAGGGDAFFSAGIDIRRPGVRAARLVLDRHSIEPGQRVAMRVRNDGRRRIAFGLGATFERYHAGRWIDAHDAVCPDGCGVPRILLSAPPGETAGPRYGVLRDTVRFPADAPEGLYRLTKPVLHPHDVHAREIELRARVRIRASGNATGCPARCRPADLDR